MNVIFEFSTEFCKKWYVTCPKYI